MAEVYNEEDHLSVIEEFPSIDHLHELLNKFSFNLVQFLEQNFIFYHNVLEDNAPNKKQTLQGKIASSLATAVPVYGKTIGAAISNGEIFYLNKLDKQRSLKLANLIYNFADNRDNFRELIVQSAVEVFYCWETQFGRVTCNGGPKRAIFKLAKDASHRILSYLLGNDDDFMGKDDFCKGVVFGRSLRNKFMQNKGRSLGAWKTSSVFEKCGLVEDNKYYKNNVTNTGKYGYRRLFGWETIGDNWIEEEKQENVKFLINKEDFKDLENDVKLFIASKNAFEEAKQERYLYFEELKKLNQDQHDDVLENLEEYFENLKKYYSKLCQQNKKQTEILVDIKEKQIHVEEKQNVIVMKLEEIHQDVKDAKENKRLLMELQKSQKKLEEKQQVNVNEVAKATSNLLIKEGTQKIAEEIDRNVKKLENEAKRNKNKLKKFGIKL